MPKDEEPVFVAESGVYTVRLYQDKVVIEKGKLIGGSERKEIPIDKLTGVKIQNRGRIRAGYIQFIQSGYSDYADGRTDVPSDENSVPFKKNSEKFKELKEKLDELQKQDNNGSESNSAIQRLKQRFAEGEIDDEEYQNKLEILKDD